MAINRFALLCLAVCPFIHALPQSTDLCDQGDDRNAALLLLQAKADVLPRTRRAVHGFQHPRREAAFAAAVAQVSQPTGPPTANETAAEMSGVALNAAGDLEAFLSALVTNTVMLIIFFVVASVLRQRYPLVLSGNVIADKVPFTPDESFFGWWSASSRLSIDEAAHYAGLDQAMLLSFAEEAMKLLAIVGAPLVLIVGPLHCFFGGGRAGDDNLSKWGMANVVDEHPWLYWLHAFIVWIVVITTQRIVLGAMRSFLVRRNAWLQGMPAPRSTTVLVEGIPEERCSDQKLREYFDKIFGGAVVESAVVIKDTTQLLKKVAARERVQLALDAAVFKNDTEDIAARKQQLEMVEADINAEKAEIRRQSAAPGLTNLTCGFVTFKNRRDAELAKMMAFTPDADEFTVEIPPDPTDIIYADLQRDPHAQRVRDFLGYCLIAGVFWAYMPCVLGISYFTSLENLQSYVPAFKALADSPSSAALWDGLVSSLALQLFIGFVPTFFVLIFSNFFVLKAEAWVQHRIQDWYFYFQVVFVLLVTAIGSSLMKTAEQLAEHPTMIFSLLAETLPLATHFYLNYLPLQWVTHGQNLTRIVSLFKFKAFSAIYEEPQAKEMSEPEDQDYYGLGSRSARFAFMLVLSLVFCSLSPLITILGFINFFVCRKVYGYLVVFAETKKPDLGGVFFCTQLHHLQQGMFLYIILMTGVLLQRDTHTYPGLIAGSSLVYMYFSYNKFRGIRWQSLCFQELVEGSKASEKKRVASRDTYQQPELCD
eukprot:CAMPEP_0170583920 /NCGR_PEP_ID=MMETSP0224-20130122/8410_1 /TAXON_ID=285029 /ORGANISM="Togula jolla, Strain CCCM 725" /LENGTH=764 /DNA_ID=CAMNT_0010907315 /DNA_START=78 /DNA_END=2372 /DNA_ORIENTATION=+